MIAAINTAAAAIITASFDRLISFELFIRHRTFLLFKASISQGLSNEKLLRLFRKSVFILFYILQRDSDRLSYIDNICYHFFDISFAC